MRHDQRLFAFPLCLKMNLFHTLSGLESRTRSAVPMKHRHSFVLPTPAHPAHLSFDPLFFRSYFLLASSDRQYSSRVPKTARRFSSIFSNSIILYSLSPSPGTAL